MEALQDDEIRRFMQARKVEVADNGFTHSVMRRLPHRRRWLELLLNGCGIAACLLLFWALDGFHIFFLRLQELLSDIPIDPAQLLSFPSLMMTWGVLIAIVLYRTCTEEA